MRERAMIKERVLWLLMAGMLVLFGWILVQTHLRLRYCTEMGYDAYEMTPEGRVRCLIERER